ncbi:MAG: hypothetical protein ACKO6M_08880, partial [Bacteroidota bacterium]
QRPFGLHTDGRCWLWALLDTDVVGDGSRWIRKSQVTDVVGYGRRRLRKSWDTDVVGYGRRWALMLTTEVVGH